MIKNNVILETVNVYSFYTDMNMDSNQEKKKIIADAFKEHFQYYGYKKTTVDDIAKELHISKKTIYQYFSTKEKVFYFIISHIAKQYAKNIQQKLREEDTVQKKFMVLINIIFKESRKWLKKNDAFEFKYKYELSAMVFLDAYALLIKELLVEGIKKGEFPEMNVELKVHFVQGILGQSLKLLSQNFKLDLEQETYDAIIKIL